MARQVRQRPAGRRLAIAKNTPTHGVHGHDYRDDCLPIDVSPLNHILDIDPQRRTATVEGQVQLGRLCQATLAHGLLPAVVPEYADFTVAGLINGDGIQSSSHRYGLFKAIHLELEVVLGDGSVVVASDSQHADLHSVVGASMGTLGIVSAATLRLVEAKPFVRCRYQRFRTLDAYAAAMADGLMKTAFLEGIIFGPDCYVLLTGDFADDPEGLPVAQPRAYGQPYFYQRVKRALSRQDSAVDVMTTLDYLGRSERGGWWMAECFVDIAVVPGTSGGRRWMDRLDESRKRARDRFAPEATGVFERERCVVLQDIGFRMDRLPEAVRWVQRNLDLYPIWNCPFLHPGGETSGHLVDIGLYGEPRVPRYESTRLMREFQLMSDVPSMWGLCYLTREELRSSSLLDFAVYDQVRRDYAAEDAFLDLAAKVVRIDPRKPAAPRPPLWRLHLSFGPQWYRKPAPWLILVAAQWANFVWAAGQWLGRRWSRRAPA